jgi:hypothetical protein
MFKIHSKTKSYIHLQCAVFLKRYVRDCVLCIHRLHEVVSILRKHIRHTVPSLYTEFDCLAKGTNNVPIEI